MVLLQIESFAFTDKILQQVLFFYTFVALSREQNAEGATLERSICYLENRYSLK